MDSAGDSGLSDATLDTNQASPDSVPPVVAGKSQFSAAVPVVGRPSVGVPQLRLCKKSPPLMVRVLGRAL